MDGSAQPVGLDIRGIRIGLNGAEAPVGQSYAHLDTEISTAYTAAAGQRLTELGAVVPLEKGPDDDEFFLTFDTIGPSSFNRPAQAPPPAPTPVDLAQVASVGVRTFDEISATMAAITGVSPNDSAVAATFNVVRQSLPATENVEAVLASHQVSIAQLAIEYCNALMENRGTQPRETVFAGFNFDAAAVRGVSGAANRAIHAVARSRARRHSARQSAEPRSGDDGARSDDQRHPGEQSARLEEHRREIPLRARSRFRRRYAPRSSAAPRCWCSKRQRLGRGITHVDQSET